MGIEDAVNKGKDLYEQNKDKIAEAVKSEQAEDISDKVLDGVADFAKKIAPGAADKIAARSSWSPPPTARWLRRVSTCCSPSRSAFPTCSSR